LVGNEAEHSAWPPAPKTTVVERSEHGSLYLYIVPQKKNQTKLFMSQLRQISTNSDNFWRKKMVANSLKLYKMCFII